MVDNGEVSANIELRRKELYFSTMMGIVFSIIASVYFYFTGYPLVNTATEILNLVTPPIYMLPVFFPFGILVGDVINEWLKKEQGKAILLFSFVIIIGGYSFFRLISNIPLSGHAIIITYYLLYEIFYRKRVSLTRMLAGVIPYSITIFYKFLIWNDPLTFVYGSLFGAGIGIVHYLFTRVTRKLY